LLRILSIYSGILPIAVFFLFLNRNRKDGLWVIFLYVLVSSIIDLTFEFTTLPGKIQFFLFSIFTLLEYSLFSAFLYINFKKSLFKKILIVISIIFYFFCFYSFSTTKDYSFDSLPASIEAILIIIFCIFFFYEQINNPEVSFIYSSKKFWVATAFLIYLSGTLFLFIYSSNLSVEDQESYWPINFVFNILKNLFIALAFFIPVYKNHSFLHNITDDFFETPLTHHKP